MWEVVVYSLLGSMAVMLPLIAFFLWFHRDDIRYELLTIRSWLKNLFPRHRVNPTERDVVAMQNLYRQVFGNPAGRELIELWVEQIVLANPRSTDSGECIRYASQCAFVEDIIKALDKAQNPGKYESELEQVGTFDARKGWAA